LRWKPDEITFQDITQPSCSLRGLFVLRAEAWVRSHSKSPVTTVAE
jgi:hypothetical protein